MLRRVRNTYLIVINDSSRYGSADVGSSGPPPPPILVVLHSSQRSQMVLPSTPITQLLFTLLPRLNASGRYNMAELHRAARRTEAP